VEYSSVSKGKELLLQDGHAREVCGARFHPDGLLVAATDFGGGVVQCRDLRTGTSVCHFLGHAKRVVCSEFSPNGFQLATAGDDMTIYIWDLRRRWSSTSITAHDSLITQPKFPHSPSYQTCEFLALCCFDGTGRTWSTRDWKLLSMLHDHEGKVMGIDVLDGPSCGIVTCGIDKH
jgi:U4/U6 small nuclear ribonucleoprotein PRP4